MKKVIDKYASMPFSYGTDCCRFAAECVKSLHGYDPMQGLEYRNKRQAYLIVNRYGGMEGALRHFLGEPYDGHKDGDVCLIDSNNGDAAAVVYNNRVIARVEQGLMDYPLDRAKLVWCT